MATGAGTPNGASMTMKIDSRTPRPAIETGSSMAMPVMERVQKAASGIRPAPRP